ncbi:hypothetical protein PTSG_06208 [Salpingoeca rosetta]|uniref:Fanconi anemia group I protein n=1 Tax=Salpingoeca rosetta (strain ATCC 50818 / BSB-021) TaxID=946362 RepID=F2UC89_SALR5|nr:uncharacterized protein PTSG_06208 [Salpingoeca rosetta]EGD74196.1 hypothetical protein PTSG_06208 [Salpingoeca rosetta]|eukprot:XP_004993096.1 hypothetical protein PTSG_06208 [Salpingoeca rosetta]
MVVEARRRRREDDDDDDDNDCGGQTEQQQVVEGEEEHEGGEDEEDDEDEEKGGTLQEDEEDTEAMPAVDTADDGDGGAAAAAAEEEEEAEEEEGVQGRKHHRLTQRGRGPENVEVVGDFATLKKRTRDMLRTGHKASPLLRPIFSQDNAAFDESPRGDSFRESVCLFLMQLIEDPGLHATLCSDLLDVLMVGVDSLSGDGLVAVCTQILRAVKAANGNEITQNSTTATPMSPNNKPSPSKRRGTQPRTGTGKVFELMPKALSRLETLDAITGELDTGNAFKSFFLNRLCNMPWPPQHVLPIADAFKTVNFDADQFKFAAAKLVRSLHDVATEEVPPLVYQLLLLSAKGQRAVILQGVLAFCAAQSSAAVQAPTAALRHALTQAQGTVLMHISFAVKQDQDLGRELLKLIKAEASVSPFTVAAALCLLTVPRFEQTVQSVFMNMTTKHAATQDRLCRAVWLAPFCKQSLDPLRTFKTVVNGTANGWDYITAPLLRLCFYFLDSVKSAGVSVGVSSAVASTAQAAVTATATTVSAAAASTSTAMPASLLSSKGRVGDQLRADIASAVISKAFGMHSSARSYVIDEMISRIITRSSPNINGYLALFSRLIRAHVHDFGDFTEKLRDVLDYLVFLPSDQSTAILQALLPLVTTTERLKEACILVLRKALFNRCIDARMTAVRGFLLLLQSFHDPILCTEITTSLRRCFSQQLAVRQLLYQVSAATACASPSTAPAIADLLDNQRVRLLRQTDGESGPPFIMASIVNDKADANHQTDSIGGLINALHTLSTIKEVSETHLSSFLSQFVAKMLKSDLEDFEIDKAADFSDASSGPSARNTAAAHALIECYDACINIVVQNEFTLERCQHIVTLLRKRQTVCDLLKEGNRKRKATDRCLISMQTLSRVFSFILINTDPDDAAPQAILTSKVFPMQFFLYASAHLLSQNAKSADAVQIVSMLLRESARSLASSPLAKLYDDKKNKVTIASIPALVEICSLIVSKYSQGSVTLAAKLHAFLSNLCETGDTMEDSSIVKAVCQQLLEADNYGDVAFKLTLDAQQHLGFMRLDEAEDDEQATLHYHIVSKRVCETAVIPVLLADDCDRRLADINFAIDQYTLLLKSNAAMDVNTDESQPELPCEDPLYERLLRITKTIKEMLRTVFEGRATWLRFFKTTRNLYDTLSNACRAVLLFFQTHKDTRVPKLFQRIVHFCSKHMSPQVYITINFVNEEEKEEKPRKRKGPSAADKLIPNVVYALEIYEKFVIRIEKKAHLNLLKHMKRSTARDFRISAQTMQDIISNATADDDEDEDEGAAEDDAGDEGEEEEDDDDDGDDEPAGKENTQRGKRTSKGIAKRKPTTNRGPASKTAKRNAR